MPARISTTTIKKWLLKLTSKPETFDNLAPEDIVIVVIGPTGVGKSTFINTAAGQKFLETSDDKVLKLSVCTTELAHVRCTSEDYPDRRVVFVDTPAFPDPDPSASVSEKKVGKTISDWLEKAFGKDIKITGVLYLHNGTLNRLTDPPLPHYEMFRKLCGEQYQASVVLVLTMWEKVDLQTRKSRKDELTTHWKGMTASESSAVCCHDGTKQSAWDVVKALGVL